VSQRICPDSAPASGGYPRSASRVQPDPASALERDRRLPGAEMASERG
jgi:hypothetical protein